MLLAASCLVEFISSANQDKQSGFSSRGFAGGRTIKNVFPRAVLASGKLV
jgi:hypothetical protein